MFIGDVCKHDVVCAAPGTTVAHAARLMREHHVGDVIVVDRADAERMPIGIVTDRDIVVEVMAPGIDPATVTLGDLMSWGELVTVQETDTCADAVRRMHDKAVHRVPVINRAGVLVGVVSFDDILPRLASELSQLAELAALGRRRETRTRAPA
ncbi:MAG: CBS domain-containing protein [Burkholderiales bacterium]